MDYLTFTCKGADLKPDLNTITSIIDALGAACNTTVQSTIPDKLRRTADIPLIPHLSSDNSQPEQSLKKRDSFTLSVWDGALQISITPYRGRYYLSSTRVNPVKILYAHNARIPTEEEYLLGLSIANWVFNQLLPPSSQDTGVSGLVNQDGTLISESYITSAEIAHHIYDSSGTFTHALYQASTTEISKEDSKTIIQGSVIQTVTHLSTAKDLKIIAYNKAQQLKDKCGLTLSEEQQTLHAGHIRLEVRLAKERLHKACSCRYSEGDRLASLPYDTAYSLCADRFKRFNGLYFTPTRVKSFENMAPSLKSIVRSIQHTSEILSVAPEGKIEDLKIPNLDYLLEHYLTDNQLEFDDDKKRRRHKTECKLQILNALRDLHKFQIQDVMPLCAPTPEQCEKSALHPLNARGHAPTPPKHLLQEVEPKVRRGWSKGHLMTSFITGEPAIDHQARAAREELLAKRAKRDTPEKFEEDILATGAGTRLLLEQRRDQKLNSQPQRLPVAPKKQLWSLSDSVPVNLRKLSQDAFNSSSPEDYMSAIYEACSYGETLGRHHGISWEKEQHSYSRGSFMAPEPVVSLFPPLSKNN